jgi:hypothetical protein
MPKKSRRIKKPQPKPSRLPVQKEDGKVTIRVRHQRFDGFDIYTTEIPNKEKMLFHKPQDKTLIFADTFKFLGSKDNLWLCEDITNGMIHIAPFERFAHLDKPV